MKRFKSWDEIEAFYDPEFGIVGLTSAEEELKTALETDHVCYLGDLPEAPDDWTSPDQTRHIRADVLRYALTHPKSADDATKYGVDVRGAVISGTLNIMDCTVHDNAALNACRFHKTVYADRTEFAKNLRLENSHLPALIASGAKIGGQLVCEGATFETTEDKALNLQGAVIMGLVSLKGITAEATIAMNGAQISSQLIFSGAKFETPEGFALNLEGAMIKSNLFFTKIKSIKGWINLSDTYVANLHDDPESWAKVKSLILNGFTYDHILGEDSATDFKSRLQWLEKGSHYKGKFFPQPYTQLAKVLQEMGHDRDAREVRVALAEKLGAEHRKQLRKDHASSINSPPKLGFKIAKLVLKARLGFSWLLDFLFRNVVGYGFKPARSLYWLAGLIFMAWFMALGAWETGQFAPNSAPILVSQDWIDLADDPKAAITWSNESMTGRDWETFHPLAYAADIVIPIVEIGQTSAWAPSASRGPWGAALWWMRWIFTAFGWIISALGAAAITGVIRRD